MKVLLISPPELPGLQKVKSSMVPVSLLYLASALRNENHNPFIADLQTIPGFTTNAKEVFTEVLQQSIKDFSPELFAINCFTTMHFPFVRRLAESLRNSHPHIPIVLGGTHPSLFPVDILLNCSYIDYIIIGEGEEQIVQLANTLEFSSSNTDLSHIQSFAWRKDGDIICQPRRCFLSDLDTLSDPAWDLVKFNNYYSDHSHWNNPKKLSFNFAVPIVSSRGCPFNCNFCAAKATMGRSFRMRSPKRVVDEIQMLHENYGENYFSFVDDNMNVNKRHIISICYEICRRRINIEFESISGLHLNFIDDEVIDALDQAGLVFARLAIESGNDYIRNKVIGKRLERNKIYSVCAAIKKRPRIRTAGMFVIGFPEDTCETLEDTRNMILDLQLDINYVFNLIPLPGTLVLEQAMKEGLLLPNYSVDRLWAGEITLDVTTGESPFYLKPRAMTMKELADYRITFDGLKLLQDKRM